MLLYKVELEVDHVRHEVETVIVQLGSNGLIYMRKACRGWEDDVMFVERGRKAREL